MKTCFHCQISQPLAAYAHSPNSRSPDKLGILCATCRAHLSPRDKARLETAFWRATKSEQNRANRSQLETTKIGETEAISFSLWVKQNGGCAVCGQALDKERLCLHRPRTQEKARGLLCRNCNRAMTSLRDDPALFQKAAAYLLSPKE